MNRLAKVVISPSPYGGGWLVAEFFRKVGANVVRTSTYTIDRRHYQILRRCANSEELSEEYLRLTLYPSNNCEICKGRELIEKALAIIEDMPELNIDFFDSDVVNVYNALLDAESTWDCVCRYSVEEQAELFGLDARNKQNQSSSIEETMTTPDNGPIHGWFGLTYAQYLTIPRSILQSMPVDWQRRFVDCLDELNEMFDWMPEQGRYFVRLKGEDGKFAYDKLADYERGRRRILKRNDKSNQF